MRAAFGVIARVLAVMLVVLYPVAVYFGLSRMSTRAFGLTFAAIALVSVPLRLRGAKREHVIAIARVPLTIVLMLLLAALFEERRLVLALPIVTNIVLLGNFALSLRTTPIVERFARMQDDNLTPAQVLYCRHVTETWCAFFVLNAAVIAILAAFAPLTWWTIYTSAISYVLVGALGASEYVVRKYRFRKYGANVIDRILSRIFPPRVKAEGATR